MFPTMLLLEEIQQKLSSILIILQIRRRVSLGIFAFPHSWRSTLMNTNAILQEYAHRHTPLPKGEWVMRQSWRELLFAHWPVKVQALRPLVPAALTLDTFEGEAWVGIVPFRMSEVCPRGVPALPWFSE